SPSLISRNFQPGTSRLAITPRNMRTNNQFGDRNGVTFLIVNRPNSTFTNIANGWPSRLDRATTSLYILVMAVIEAPAKKIWTEAELEALPEDGFIHEVVDGELIMSPKNNFYHGAICSRL